MNTNKDTWEEKLREKLGDDASRFPVPENQFESLKDRIKAKVKVEAKVKAEIPVSELVEEGKAKVSDDAEKALADRIKLPKPVTPNLKPLLKWAYLAALPLAAALAFFILNKETVPAQEPVNQVLMTEASEGFFELQVEEQENIKVDSQTIQDLANTATYRALQEDVLIDDYLDEDIEETDPLDELALEDIEKYLVENININSEL